MIKRDVQITNLLKFQFISLNEKIVKKHLDLFVYILLQNWMGTRFEFDLFPAFYYYLYINMKD